MKIDDSDIVDVLLGDATPDLADRVLQAVESDPKVAALHADWSAILAAARSEREAIKLMQERVIEGVMRRLDSAKISPSERAVSRWRKPRARLQRSALLASMTAAVCLIAVTGYLVLRSTGSVPLPSDTLKPQVFTSEVQFVDFGSDESGDGTKIRPFSKLKHGIAAVNRGGVLVLASGSTLEMIRIEKPVSLVATSGTVRIGGH